MSQEQRTPRYWRGAVPAVDDFGDPIKNGFVDGVTLQGHWAFMSLESAKRYARGTGTGRGQMYQKQADGRWLKIA